MVTLRPISAGKDRSSKKKSSLVARIGLIPAKIGGNLLTAGLEKITGKKYGRQTTTGLSQTTFGKILGTATVATAATAAVAVNPAAAGRLAISAGKTAAKTAAANPRTTFVAAALASTGSLIPITKTAFKAVGVAGEVATGQKPLNVETISDVGKGVGIALGVGALGTAAGLVGKKVLEGKDDVELPSAPSAQMETLQGMPLKDGSVAATSPITPETEEITSGVKRTGRKTRLQPRREKISQRVVVNVSQRNSAHRINKFIKNAVYA